MDRSCSSVPPNCREPPVTDEYVCGSRNTARVSAYEATDQKPSPSGVLSVGSCQYTGASRRCTSKRSCGKPLAKLSRSVKSTPARVTELPPTCIWPPPDIG